MPAPADRSPGRSPGFSSGLPHRHLDPRLLRGFLVVAEELHFTRAATRLYVAQQALSRDIRRLERELGAELFVRTTRQVTPTADGERLVPYARRVLEAQDALLSAFAGDGPERPLLVDVNSPGLVSGRVLDRARALAPDCELMARFESGLTGAAGRSSRGAWTRRSDGSRASIRRSGRGSNSSPYGTSRWPSCCRRTITSCGLDAVPLEALAGETVYAGAGNPRTREWTDLALHLFEGRGIALAPPAPLAVGADEFRRVMAKKRNPVLAVVDFPALPETVRKPLVGPVPLSPVSLVWRKGLVHSGIDALRRAAA